MWVVYNSTYNFYEPQKRRISPSTAKPDDESESRQDFLQG